jgi:hypothetical protein
MAITVGTVTLNQHISWRGYHNNPAVPGSEASTLGGRIVVNRLLGNNTTDVVLEAIEEDNIRKGYFTKPVLDDLRTYRDAGTPVTVNYHGETFVGVIRVKGIQVEKVLWQSEYDDEEKYIGSITFKRTGA